MAMALEGIRVVHVTRTFPASMATMYLADMGAEVIKIEEPGYMARRAVGEAKMLEQLSWIIDRNKKSVQLNLKDAEAREALLKLVDTVDVFVEGLRPGVMERLGFGYAALSARNPRLVYASLSGYGQSGPYVDLAGHDLNYISIAGILDVTGPKGAAPIPPGVPIADLGGGAVQLALGVLTALLARERTGRGQYVDAAMTDQMATWMVLHLASYLYSSQVPSRGDIFASGVMPFYRVYECADGRYISIGTTEPWLFANFCRAIGREDFIARQYAGESPEQREQMAQEIAAIMRTKTRAAWFELLRKADVCVAPVNTLDEAIRDPQLVHRGMFPEQQLPDGRRFTSVGMALKFSDTPGTVRTPPPADGEHTAATLRALGYGAAQIAAMRERGACL
ncbi:MAG: CoA transferase [Chloroflexi bacterium]|nr:CoA transferase [Chloroflexota bacterium]MBI4507300.1 CoA transferase [Chloroflexota bacterium]